MTEQLAESGKPVQRDPLSPEGTKFRAIVAKATLSRGSAAPLPIVAIGASGGGVEAVSGLLDAMFSAAQAGESPGGAVLGGAAFLLVQHPDPTHHGLLAELLAEHTAMPVVDAIDGCPLAAGHVYIIPPGRYLSVRGGTLQLTDRLIPHSARMPFDVLLQSLADGCGAQTLGVVLSGMGPDGRLGLSALAQAGGFVVAQDPDEAEYDGMPRSAIATGHVDRVVRLAEMPAVFVDRIRDIMAARHEEALSVNEAFQSANEALLTSKAELQSLSEELTALNSQLHETRERQRLTLDDLQNVLYSTNIGTLFLDRDLNIRFFTPAVSAVFNVIPGDIGRPLAHLRSLAADDALQADAHDIVAGAAPIEREVATPGGIWFVRRIFPYLTQDGGTEGVVITFTDITARKAIEHALEATKREAERANVAKSRFLAAASHDLRQPLQSLKLLKELLVLAVEGEEPRKLLARFDQTLRTISGMLNALLDINQIEAGVVQPQPVVFPLGDMFERLRDEFGTVAQARGLSLRVIPTSALVRTDPRLLEQIIRNLLGNAFKYTRQGKILLGLRHRGQFLQIEVGDTGIGIASDQLQAIFEEFHQIGNEARERSRGLGLGLSIVQRLGRLLGHAIDVRSVPGRGSLFSITVPLLQGSALAEPPPSRDETTDEPHRHCKVVIVDDDPDILELLQLVLKADGCIIRVAVDGAAALKLVTGGAMRPEVLLIDYNLPGGMNGLELVGKLRAVLNHHVPAIILTGDIATDTLVKIAGEDCIQLSKPVDPRELVQAIERLCPAKSWLASPDIAEPASLASAVTYVVDDDPDIRATLREVLQGHGCIARDYASSEAFLAAYRPGGEGCLLVDAQLPGMSGVELLRELRARGDHLPVILITGDGDIALAVEAMRAGACAFIEKPVSRAELLASITRAIAQSHDIRLVDAVHEGAAALVAELTARQREIMGLVLAGHPSKNIAADLGISQRTVENHRAAIMERMGIRSLPELARLVLQAETGGSLPARSPPAN